ncbi:hypothetical protein ACFC3F_07455 [Microbacterium sp. NPDC055910]|uniref:hypothetical protein n=1 Tax=Microbacterium sp. NPDC055910 TaxID=3345659 RepID=UPI0035D787FF
MTTDSLVNTPRRMPRASGRMRGLTALLAGAAASLLMLSGCAGNAEGETESSDAAAAPQSDTAPADQDPGQESESTDAGTATVSMGGREFSFTLTLCGVYQDSEVELAGPGGEAGSDQPSFLDGGLMQMDADVLGEFRIHIGTDRPFDSTDEFVALGASTGDGLTVVREGDGYVATGNSWDDQGTDLGTGTVRFTCR